MKTCNLISPTASWALGLIFLVFTTSCQPQGPVLDTVDESAVKEAVAVVMDDYNEAVIAKNVEAVKILLAEDGLFCGTDPSERWGRDYLIQMMESQASNPAIVIDYSLDTREIRVAPDGNSAIVLEQSSAVWFSPNLPVRSVYHLRKSGDDWIIDFLSWSFIANNQDITRLNEVLE